MKILVATGLYPPEIGGPATFAKLAETKLGSAETEHRVTVVPFSKVRKYPKIIRHIVYFFLLLKQSENQDVVLALDPISVGLPAKLLVSLKRLPFVVRLGGDYAWEQGRQRFGVTCSLDDFPLVSSMPIGLRVLKFLQTWVTKSADCVIAPSEYLKSIIVRWGVPGERIEVIYSVSNLGNDTEKKVPTNPLLAERSPVLLSIARLVPWKGFEVLVEVVAKLCDTYPKITLFIAGDGPHESTIREAINKANMSDHIYLLGRVSHAEIRAMQAEVDVFVLNTEYEGFSHVIVENMYMEVPVVTTGVGGNPELITDGETGLLTSYNDELELREAIERMIEDHELRNSCIQAAKKRADKIIRGSSMDQVESVLQLVISK